MQRADSRDLSRRLFARHRLRMLGVVAAFAPLAMASEALAICTPPVGPPPVTSTTVNCSASTTDQQGGGVGYGTLADTGNVYNILSGAQLIGTNTALVLDSGTVHNDGTVKTGPAGTLAISAGNGGMAIANSGLIQANGANAFTVSSTGVLLLNNNLGGIIEATNATSTAVNALGAGAFDLTNAGTIRATGAGSFGVFANNASSFATLTNTGTISGTVVGFESASSNPATVNNNGGTIQGTGLVSIGIHGTGTGSVIVNNAGTVSGTRNGVQSGFSNVNVSNSGTVQATDLFSAAISAPNATVSANTGAITAAALGIEAFAPNGVASVVNGSSGVITAADAITGNQAIVTNSGHITATNGVAINAAGAGAAATITNAGTITSTGGGAFAIFSTGSATLTNSGSISATGVGSAGIFAATLNATANTGNVSGVAFGMRSTGAATLNNGSGGAISGSIGFSAGGAATITNFGRIASTAGAAGTAIQLSAANDTLTLKPTSVVIGKIDMGNGNDIVNVELGASAVARGVSSISLSAGAAVTAVRAQLLNFDTTTGDVLNVIGGSFSGVGQPTATSGAVTASLDPTALAQQDRVLSDFTGGISSMVQGRLNGAGSSGLNMTTMSYAMDDSTSVAANANAQIFSKAPAAGWAAAPVTVWSSAFGGQRTQNETDTTLRSTSTAFGGALGVDRKLRPDWLIGVFAGGGAGSLSADLSSAKVDTEYVFGGGYSRYEWANQFVDVTVQGGNAHNRSSRTVQNGFLGSIETASASYNGWFLSPELAYGYRLSFANGYLLTPTARLRYVAGFFDGYNETGSAQTLSVGRRTLQDLEERAEIDLSKSTSFFGGEHVLKASVHGGVIALQRIGDTTISTVLIGQNLAFATPGKASTVGAVIGAGFNYQTSRNVALFGAIEGMAMSDQSRTATAKGGVRVAF